MFNMFRKDATDADDGGEADAPVIETSEADGALSCVLSGVWNTRTVADIDHEIRDLEANAQYEHVHLDLSGISGLDTAGAWLIHRLVDSLGQKGAEVTVDGPSEAATTLLSALDEATKRIGASDERVRGGWFLGIFAVVGKSVYNARDDILYGLHILGATIRGAQTKPGRASAINPAAIASQIDRMGVGAIPVVLLMSAIVGAIIAQQGAFQLRYFGAEIFVVDLVGILIMRELGVLMTAIMVAGRTGSAITAEIGAMKMREEVDALHVIGLNPIGVLVFPRLVALMIAVPCLTVLANFAALGGAMFVAWSYSGIAPAAFIARLQDSIDLSTVLAGLIKAPFMALIIGIIGSIEGMQVGGSAESLGRHVTASVVKSIFIVIVVDGMFAIFYAAINF